MPGQILNFLAQFKKLSNAMLFEVQTRFLELSSERVLRIRVFPRTHKFSQPVQSFRIERKNFTNFASGGLAAVGDDIGGHRGAQLPIALVNVLNGASSLIPTRQIQVDVWPLTAFFGKKSFEKEIHPHGINGGNAKRIADRAVRGRTSALNQNIFFLAKANDIPNDEEVTGQVEFFDNRQFAFHLLPGAFMILAVAANHPL